VKQVSTDNFGLLIAYLLPGFVALWGVGFFSDTARSWLAVSPMTAPTVGGFLYVTLGSTAAGLIVSAVRWFLLDRLFHRTGIPEPTWQFAHLQDRLASFETLVEYHYRYYQFYSNTLIALTFTYVSWLVRFPRGPRLADLGIVLIGLVLFFGSRDTLSKYYTRTSMLIPGAARAPKGSPGGAPKGET